MRSVIVKDVPPFCVVIGNPAHFEKFNSYSFEQLGISTEDLMIEDFHLKSEHQQVNEFSAVIFSKAANS